jgi:ribosome-associated protein
MVDEPAPSRTRRKQQDRDLQRLGERLLELSREQLEALAIPAELKSAVFAAKGPMPRVALRRQLQYIGVLMRGLDPQPIRSALETARRGESLQGVALKCVERWHAGLQAGNLVLIEEILAACPDADRQRLGQLARNARREPDTPGQARASRLLWRYLRQVARMPPAPPALTQPG